MFNNQCLVDRIQINNHQITILLINILLINNHQITILLINIHNKMYKIWDINKAIIIIIKTIRIIKIMVIIIIIIIIKQIHKYINHKRFQQMLTQIIIINNQ